MQGLFMVHKSNDYHTVFMFYLSVPYCTHMQLHVTVTQYALWSFE